MVAKFRFDTAENERRKEWCVVANRPLRRGEERLKKSSWLLDAPDGLVRSRGWRTYVPKTPTDNNKRSNLGWFHVLPTTQLYVASLSFWRILEGSFSDWARSRLYQRQSLRPNTPIAAFFENHKIIKVDFRCLPFFNAFAPFCCFNDFFLPNCLSLKLVF